MNLYFFLLLPVSAFKSCTYQDSRLEYPAFTEPIRSSHSESFGQVPASVKPVLLFGVGVGGGGGGVWSGLTLSQPTSQRILVMSALLGDCKQDCVGFRGPGFRINNDESFYFVSMESDLPDPDIGSILKY